MSAPILTPDVVLSHVKDVIEAATGLSVAKSKDAPIAPKQNGAFWLESIADLQAPEVQMQDAAYVWDTVRVTLRYKRKPGAWASQLTALGLADQIRVAVNTCRTSLGIAVIYDERNSDADDVLYIIELDFRLGYWVAR